MCPGLRHVTESIGNARDRERCDRQRCDFAGFQHRVDLGQQLFHQLWLLHSDRRKIENGKLDVLAQGLQSDGGIGINVALADLEEAAIRGEDVHAFRDVSGRKRIQDDINALAVRDAHDLVCEVEIARVHDVLDAEAC